MIDGAEFVGIDEVVFREAQQRLVIRVLMSDGSIRSVYWHAADLVALTVQTAPPTHIPTSLALQ